MVKRTYTQVARNASGKLEPTGKKVTCEAWGKTDDGSTIWRDIETGNQYFCFNIDKKMYFCKVF